MSNVTDTQVDLVEKWMLTVSLMGLTDVKELWDSNGDTYNALNYMEELEQHQQLISAKDTAMLAAQRAQQMGVTTDLLVQYSEHVAEVAYQTEQARLVEEEANNALLNSLRINNDFKIKVGPKAKQVYWSFTGDIGHGGTFDYQCRIVKISWSKMRVWHEWTDSKGIKHREKNLDSRYDYSMGDHWPELWCQSSRNPSYTRLPYVYTHYKLMAEANRKAEQAQRAQKREERRLRKLAQQQPAVC